MRAVMHEVEQLALAELGRDDFSTLAVGSHVTLRYRNPQTGEEIQWTVPIPCSPELLHKIDAMLAKQGFERVDEP